MTTPAPPEIVYCSRCGAKMITRRVGDKPRRACPACGFIHFTDPKVGVGVCVVQDGKVLLVRRVMEPERGKWSVPAGFVDAGEDPADVAVRETMEETNLRVAVEGLIDVFHNPLEQGGASIFILYRARLLDGEMQAGDDADRVGFFPLHALPPLAFASTKEMIRLLVMSG